MIGAIVAGGPSSRFNGEPKGLHTVGGVRIVDRVASALREACSNVILVSSSPGAQEWLPGHEVVRDEWPARGSLVGIHAALRRTGEPTLIVAWDMPFVTGDLVRLLRDRSNRSMFATVPHTGQRFEPLCAVYTPRCLPSIETALANDAMSVGGILAQLPEFEQIGLADLQTLGKPETLFLNVNDAASLSHARGVHDEANRASGSASAAP